MKYKTTKKEMKENYNKIIGLGYCDAQYLLKGQSANSYCDSVYGWACDNYDIFTKYGNILLSTGYRPIKSKNINKSDKKVHEIIRKYENIAQNITDKDLKSQSISKKCDELLHNCINEILESEAK